MNPKAEIFFDAITLLREDIVEEAQDYRFRKKQAGWKKFGSLAACLALIASISLLMLPRGCGGSAPADTNGSGAPPMQNADSCAPAEEPASSEPMPEPGEAPDTPEGGYGQIETVQFTATVMEIRDDCIWLKRLESANEDDWMEARTDGLELPELAVGDIVRITHIKGPIYTTNPPILPQIISIEKIND